MHNENEMNKDEIVLIMGIQAAGKSTLVKPYEDAGYFRLNRDLLGGTLEGLNQRLKQKIQSGQRRFVLDNTYANKAQRKPILDIGREYNIPVRCVHLTTSIEDAQYNAALRMLNRYGRLLEPEELTAKKDPNSFPPIAQFRYRNEFEAPSTEEGFHRIENIPFVRTPNAYTNKAIILDYDGCLRENNNGEKYPTELCHIRVLPRRAEVLKSYQEKGYILCGVSNQSGVASGKLTQDAAKACFDETNRLLGVSIDYAFCPHRVGPPAGYYCFCRKPMTGFAAMFIERYGLRAADCIFVGDMTSDKTFAARCGFQYQHPAIFFGDAKESLEKVKKAKRNK